MLRQKYERADIIRFRILRISMILRPSSCALVNASNGTSARSSQLTLCCPAAVYPVPASACQRQPWLRTKSTQKCPKSTVGAARLPFRAGSSAALSEGPEPAQAPLGDKRKASDSAAKGCSERQPTEACAQGRCSCPLTCPLT